MGVLNAFIHNEPAMVALISLVVAAFLKFLFILITQQRLDWERFFGTGGMPSTHTTPVIACATSIGIVAGFDSPVFAIAGVVAVVVAYDAAGLRRHAGEQARAMNSLIKDLTEGGLFKGMHPTDFFKRWNLAELETLLGHNPIEVWAGVLLGIAVAILVHVYLGGWFAAWP